VRIRGNFVRQKLQSYEAVETRIFGFIDDAHSSPTKLFDHRVMGDGFADHGLWLVMLGAVQGEVNDGAV
jgi:hypothetical protein